MWVVCVCKQTKLSLCCAVRIQGLHLAVRIYHLDVSGIFSFILVPGNQTKKKPMTKYYRLQSQSIFILTVRMTQICRTDLDECTWCAPGSVITLQC